jgi:serine/threonine protein phosphatase PrpC
MSAATAATDGRDAINVAPALQLDALSAAVTTANQALRHIVDADPAVGSMGTTLTAMLWSGETAAICHIGDSRAYLLRSGDFYQITRDHTFVQALIDQGRIRPEEAATHPQRSLLLRALDGRTDADPDLSVLTAQAGDRFLLCSDGLPVAVSDEQILEVLADISEPSDAVLRLIELAIAGGGPDNITCIVADVIDTSESKLKATTIPVVAGAAASNANDTKPIPRPKADGDSGVDEDRTIGQTRGRIRRSRKRAWNPGRRGLTPGSSSAERLHLITYRATFDVPRELVAFTSRSSIPARSPSCLIRSPAPSLRRVIAESRLTGTSKARSVSIRRLSCE